jgi:hypothetical protein
MAEINGSDVRTILLEVIQEQNPKNDNQNLQSGTILSTAAQRLGLRHNNTQEQLLLTEWYELFRTGYMAWGFNIQNPNPPFCHLTKRGETAVGNFSRDPANPEGYMLHLQGKATINPIASSYLREGLDCYSAGSYKAAVVMVGAAAESIILELRNSVRTAITAKSRELPKGLEDWRIRTISNALVAFFDGQKRTLPTGLKEAYEAYWPAFAQQIRSVRNEVGHPSSIDPITPDTVHAQYLVFPELAELAQRLNEWLGREYQ